MESDPSNPDDFSERRLRSVVRLVFYPVAVALIAVAWHQRQAGAADAGDTPVPAVTWDGSTGQGGQMAARTVNGRLVYFDADLLYVCPDQPTIRWRWRPGTRDVPSFAQHGTAVHGQMGPRSITSSNTHQYGTVTTRIHATMGDHPRGTLSGEMVLFSLSPGSRRPSTRVSCTTGPLPFTLRTR